MSIGWLSGEHINRRCISENFLIFIAIIEKNLKYTLKLVSTLENHAVNCKKENRRYKLDKLKSDIKAEILNYRQKILLK